MARKWSCPLTVSVQDPDDIPEFISTKVGFLVESYELVDEHRVLTDSEAVDVAMHSFKGMRDNDAFETPPEMLEKSTTTVSKRHSSGKSFDTTNRRFRAFLGAMLYGKGFPEFNRPAEI